MKTIETEGTRAAQQDIADPPVSATCPLLKELRLDWTMQDPPVEADPPTMVDDEDADLAAWRLSAFEDYEKRLEEDGDEFPEDPRSR